VRRVQLETGVCERGPHRAFDRRPAGHGSHDRLGR
jgi:hypothetical protein